MNLALRAAPANADTKDMVAARQRFLAAGWYRPLTEAVVAALAGAMRVVEVGAGTAHYLAAYLNAMPGAVGLATDVSPAACRVAARAHPRLGAVVADTWVGLPIGEGVIDAVLCVFAPRNPAEFARILGPGGRVIVATPNAGHLADIRDRLSLLGIESDKLDRLDESLAAMHLVRRDNVVHRLELPAEAAADLIAMGPNAFHGKGSPGAVSTQAAFTVSVYESS